MIRNLKAMLLGALAVSAFGVLVSPAQATQFTAPGAGAGVTTTLNFSKDPKAKVKFHVFDFGISFGCPEIKGPAHIIGPQNNEITLTPEFIGCELGGQAVKVTNTGCLFRFTANGELHIVSDLPNECKTGAGGSPIDIEFPGCKSEVPAQTIKGFKYYNLNAADEKVGSNEGSKITIEAFNLTGITYFAQGCGSGTASNGAYTNGSTIVTGERAGVPVEVRWDA